MSASAARWFALLTAGLAILAVCMAAVTALRLHRTRATLAALRASEGCSPAADSTGLR